MKLINLALIGAGAYLIFSKSGSPLYQPAPGTLDSSAVKAKMVEWAQNPGYENVANGVYYNVNGQIYTDESVAIWQELDGKWYAGDKSGTIAPISAPAWAS